MKKILLLVPLMMMAIACSKDEGTSDGEETAIISKFENDPAVNRLLLIKHTGGSDAKVKYLVRKDGKFAVINTSDGYVGRNGIGKEREGDDKTPAGTYSPTSAFGIKDNPGTLLPFIKITPSIFACDEEGKYYNTIIDTTGTGHICHGEHMIEYTDEYEYGFTINYNPKNEYPKGSSNFIHCKGVKKYTFGGVSLDSSLVLEMMKGSDSGLRIHIY